VNKVGKSNGVVHNPVSRNIRILSAILTSFQLLLQVLVKKRKTFLFARNHYIIAHYENLHCTCIWYIISF